MKQRLAQLPGAYRARMLGRRVRHRMLAWRARRSVARFPHVADARLHGLKAPLVITLTSYPPRFAHLGKTLRSLLDQTVRPDQTVLWVADADFDRLPRNVLELEAHGLEVRRTEDLRSYKKLVPALRENPARYLVTADDDVYYPPDWLQGLVEVACEHPHDVVAYRAHIASLDAEGKFLPYRDWNLATDRSTVSGANRRLFPTGVGGVLYPPNAFVDGVDDEQLFMRLAPHGDDIWFFWMARLAKTGHRRTSRWFDIVDWPSSQDVALYADNMLSDGNDRQIRAMQAHFGPVP